MTVGLPKIDPLNPHTSGDMTQFSDQIFSILELEGVLIDIVCWR